MWKRFVRHIKRWNIWRKRSLNGRFHKFLTLLFGGRCSPTFAYTLTEDEIEEWKDEMRELITTYHGETIDI